MVDLHIHTNASDGMHSPAETVGIARKSGMDTIAITDHDTMDGVTEAQAAGKELDICVIPGAEFSAKFETELHILAYNIDAENQTLQHYFDHLVMARRDKIDMFIKKLNEAGVAIDISDIPAPAGRIIGRGALARALVSKKYASTVNEAFKKYLIPGCPTYVPGEKESWEKILLLINEAGGKSAIAHPVYLGLDEKRFESLVRSMADHGLGGLEAFYPAHTPYQSHYYYTLTQRLGLIATGGSDFHGGNVRGVSMGQGLRDYQTELRESVEKILEK